MVQVKYQDEQFLVKGVIDLGYAGKYENKDFLSPDDEDVAIAIDFELDEIIEDEWDCLEEYTENTDGDSIAKAIESYLNKQEKKVASSNYFNNQMVERLVDTLYGVALEFWEETPEFVIQSKMPKPEEYDGEGDCDCGNIDGAIYNKKFTEWAEELEELVGDSELHTIKEDLIVRFKELLPMFDVEKFFSEIKGRVLFLEDNCIKFECDDSSSGMSIFCSAYSEVDDDLNFDDWHNQ